MEKKVLKYLGKYFDKGSIEKNVEAYGSKKTIIEAMGLLVHDLGLQSEYLRKEMSVYIERIVSIEEFKSIIEWGLVPC